jgi:hypothetical protein
MSSTHERPTLRLDWCSYAAAKYAVEHWHYSRTMPRGKLVKVGAWEDHAFIGSIVFGDGQLGGGKTFMGIDKRVCAELVRIALCRHRTPVSRVIAIALRMLRKACPDIRLVVSFADPAEGHHGGVYQASGWLYTGQASPVALYRNRQTGRMYHERDVNDRGSKIRFGKRARIQKTADCEVVRLSAKHRYLMPLDDAMRAQIEPLRKPYPKRAPDRGTSDHQSEADGANPIRTLQSTIAEAVTSCG